MINPAGLNAKGNAIATERLKAQGFEGNAGYRDMMNKLPNSDYANENDRPKAFMVWMLFDNEMKLVKTGKSSGARQIPEGAGQVKQMAENEIVMDQGGFLTAYTVNESPASVYIDNFQLSMASGLVLEINNYYPFGMLNGGITSPGISDPLNNYKYNGKELQKDLSLEWLDYGARFYDPVIARWGHIDPKTELYFQITPYAYAANTPVNAIDPNGQLVIFVAGQNSGNGDNSSYWSKTQTSTYNTVTHRNTGPHQVLANRFDVAVENHFDDKKGRYYDGALGGWKNTFWSTSSNNLSLGDRMNEGHSQGNIDAGAIIKSLARTGGVITESIKVIAHSMGAAYAKGLITAIVEYAKSHPAECRGLKITEYDFAAYQQNYLSAIPGVPLFQFDNNGDYVVGNGLTSSHAKEKGREETGSNDNVNADGGHKIIDFMGAINGLTEGTYKFIDGQFVKQ